MGENTYKTLEELIEAAAQAERNNEPWSARPVLESLRGEAGAFLGLAEAQRLAHKTATDAGWYKSPETGEVIERNFGEVVALMHSELSEALEADRKGLADDKLPHRDGREVEFADCIIRIFDTAAALGLDVPGAIIEKNRFNKERADHKPANRANGGKKY
jgi:NTP pyrophosphatase (non-canonical NTP hydrolase)